MLLSALPTKIPTPFADQAGASYKRAVPIPSQQNISGMAGAASFTDGFPPLCFLSTTSGGVPPAGVDFNGILNQITAWNRWQAAGGTVQYDSTFSAAVAGYPANAVLASTTIGILWLNTVDGNTTNPDAGNAVGWVAIGGASAVLPPASLALLTKVFTQTGDTSGYAANATNTVQLQNASADFGTMASGIFTFTKSGLYVVSYDFYGSVSLGAQSTVGFFTTLKYTPSGGSAGGVAPLGITAGPANPVGASQSSGTTRQFNAGDTLSLTFYPNTGGSTVNSVTALAATNLSILRAR